MSMTSRIKATASNIVSNLTRKQSYNSGDETSTTANASGKYKAYTRLANRQTRNLSYSETHIRKYSNACK